MKGEGGTPPTDSSGLVIWSIGDKVVLSGEGQSRQRRPYYLVERTSPVQWKLARSPWATETLVVHVEDMRHWTDADDSAYLVIDQDADTPPLSSPQLLRLNAQQRLDPQLLPLITFIERGQLPTDKKAATNIQRMSEHFAIDGLGSLVTTRPPRDWARRSTPLTALSSHPP